MMCFFVPLVGVQGNPSLLEIVLFFSGGLKQMEATGQAGIQ